MRDFKAIAHADGKTYTFIIEPKEFTRQMSVYETVLDYLAVLDVDIAKAKTDGKNVQVDLSIIY